MPNRTSPRHASFDYRTPAAYFVTVCTHERRCLFGTVRQGRMDLNEIGTIVAEEWQRSEEMREEVILDAFVVMPNHLHGIVCLVPPEVDDLSPRGYDLRVGPTPLSTENASSDDTSHDDVGTHGDAPEPAPNDDVGTTGGSSLRSREETRPKGPSSQSLSAILAGFKSAATTRINQHRGTPGAPVWHADSGRHKISGSRGGTSVPTTVGRGGVSRVHRAESSPMDAGSESSCPGPLKTGVLKCVTECTGEQIPV